MKRVWIDLNRYLLGAYCELVLLTNALILWTLANSLSTLTTTTNNQTNLFDTLDRPLIASGNIRKWIKIEAQYKHIRQLARGINKSVGMNVTLFLLEFIFLYAVGLDIFFMYRHEEWAKIVHFIFYLSSSCAILVISADASNKVRTWSRPCH